MVIFSDWFQYVSYECGDPEVLLAVIKGANGRSHLSHHVLMRAILHFYTQHRLFPNGVVAEMSSTQEWAVKMAKALKRMDFWLVSIYNLMFSGLNLYVGKWSSFPLLNDHYLLCNLSHSEDRYI